MTLCISCEFALYIVLKGLVSGSYTAGFCRLHFTQLEKNTLFLIKIRQKRARIIKGWFKYMTDCKNLPDNLFVPSDNLFEPTNSRCVTNPLNV